jgi:hypothetical protein
VDNDVDGKTNCKDNDCAGEVCRSETKRKLSPTRDLHHADYTFNGSSVEVDDAETLSLASTMSVFSYGIVHFDQIPAESLIDVKSAHLIFYEEVGTVSVSAKDPSGSVLEATVPGTGAGFRRVEVTRLVKAWADSSELKKYLYLYYNSSGMGTARIRSSEHTDTGTRPYLELSYDAVCSAGECFSF